MSVYSLLRARLVATAGVSGRVYPINVPQDPTYPAVTYQRVSNTGTQGTSDRRESRWQIDCWGQTYAATETVAAAVKTAMEEWHDIASTGIEWARVVNEIDDFDQEPERTGVYRIIVDVVLHTTGD